MLQLILEFPPMSFDITPVILLRQSLVCHRVSSGSRSSVVAFFPENKLNFFGLNRLDFHSFLMAFYGELQTGSRLPKNYVTETISMNDFSGLARLSFVHIFRHHRTELTALRYVD